MDTDRERDLENFDSPGRGSHGRRFSSVFSGFCAGILSFNCRFHFSLAWPSAPERIATALASRLLRRTSAGGPPALRRGGESPSPSIVSFRVLPEFFSGRAVRCLSAVRILSVLVAALASGLGGAAGAELSFERDVRPILKANCFQCHGEGEKTKGGLDARLRRLLVKGGESGPAIVPGKPEASRLFELIQKGEMPKGEHKLSAAQVQTIGRWIAGGARTLRAEPEQLGKEPYFTEEERGFWAFQPVKRPPVPRRNPGDPGRNPIDAFLLANLRANGLGFSPTADKRTLIRRASFDLLGLPPTPEEVEAFVADKSPSAYERLIQRLLDSPHYGEHWGRHWLDVAGYADSDGYTEADPVRNYAYKFRDYVIRSFNADKPFDRFIVEQLAGDELVKPPLKNLPADAIETLTGTGFLRMAPDGTATTTIEAKVTRNAVVADTLKIVSTSLLGLTMGCAECHDHRYDPIPQVDYYRFRAIFEPALDWKNWRTPTARLLSLQTDADRAKAAGVEAEAAKLDAARKVKEDGFIEATLVKEIAKLAEDLREPAREARKTAADKRTPAQQKLLKEYPSLNVSPGSLYLYDSKAAAELKKAAEEAAAKRATKPVEDFLHVLTESAGPLPATHLFHRGDPDQPKAAVDPGEPVVLAAAHPAKIPAKDAALTSSGRRLALAKSLTDGGHPLTARVLVNRVWMHHFGRGLVGTPGDFGFLGERPTHPELLDWLASEFVAQGWSLKKLHQLILTSHAWQQVATRTAEGDRIDPDNRLLGRMSIRRLEAETIRDAMLAVGGKLNPKLYGPPVPVMEDDVGQIIIGKENKDGEGKPGAWIPLNNEEFRRSLYVIVQRSRPLGMLEAFDAPVMEPNCEARNATTVAPQSLMLMNNQQVLALAEHLAQRVQTEVGAEPRAQAVRAWRLAFSVRPSEVQTRAAVGHLAAQLAHYRAQAAKAAKAVTPVAAAATATGAGASAKAKVAEAAKTPEPELAALTSLCHAFLSANGFLYVD